MFRRAVGGVCTGLAVIALVGCSGVSGNAEKSKPQPLEIGEAAQNYLSLVCPVNEQWDAIDAAIDGERLLVQRGESTEETAKHASGQLVALAKTVEAAATGLEEPEAPWPKSAQQPISDLATAMRADAKQLRETAKLTAEKRAEAAWSNAEVTANAAAAARSSLDLSDDERGSCAQWKAEQTEKKQADDGDATSEAGPQEDAQE